LQPAVYIILSQKIYSHCCITTFHYCTD